MHEQALLIEAVSALAMWSAFMAYVVNDCKENRGGLGRQLHATTARTVQTLGLRS